MPILKFLYPIALIYGFITWVRNKLFDWGLLKQKSYQIPIIGIGNLALGGTGKTPHIEYFISKYQQHFRMAVVSRGYGRRTKGFRYINTNDLPEDSGDEPLQIKKKFHETIVAVGESRVLAIDKILFDHPEVNLILLDDAYQHRYVRPSLNILLSEYNFPFWKDTIVPAGRLREFAFGWKRADLIIFTKSPIKLELKIPKTIQIKPFYFSRIIYQDPVLISGNLFKKVILVTGIANSKPLLRFLKEDNYEVVHHFNFPDHYNFNYNDLVDILDKYNKFDEVLILTTEKDWMRLNPLMRDKTLHLAYIPIGVFIENEPDWLDMIFKSRK